MEKFGISKIEDAWISEASNEDITEIPDDFYEKAGNYVAKISREINESEDLKKNLLEEELRHAIDFVQEIYLFRILKMMDSVIEDNEPKLIEKEQKSFNEIKNSLKNLREELVSPVLEREPYITPPEDFSNTLILITSKIPVSITGSDMCNYGPFEKGEIANLPRKTSELLTKQGLAEKIETKRI